MTSQQNPPCWAGWLPCLAWLPAWLPPTSRAQNRDPWKLRGFQGFLVQHPSKKKCSDAHRKMRNKEEANDKKMASRDISRFNHDSKGNQHGCWFLPGKKCLGQTLSNRLIFREWDAEMLQVWLCLGSRWCIMDDLIFSSDFFTSLYVHQNALAIIRYSAFEYDHRAGFSKTRNFFHYGARCSRWKRFVQAAKESRHSLRTNPVFQLVKMIRW